MTEKASSGSRLFESTSSNTATNQGSPIQIYLQNDGAILKAAYGVVGGPYTSTSTPWLA